MPSAFAMARLLRDGVGEKGRRAWPPRSSSKERIVARTWESSDMVSDSMELSGEGGNVKVTWSLAQDASVLINNRSLDRLPI